MKITLIVIIAVFALFAIISALYVLSLGTAKKRPQGGEFARVNYAHRGCHDKEKGIPENSLLAFDKAVELGYGIELDVQLSKDGVPVVFHDYTLNRVCGIDGRVCDFTAQELGKFSLCGIENETVPTFAQVLERIGGRVPLLVEIKAEFSAIETTVAAQKLLDGYSGKYCVESFNPFVIRWYKKNRPNTVRGLLSDMFKRNSSVPKITVKHRILRSMSLNFICKPDFISYNFMNKNSLPMRLVRKIYRPYTFAWTPRNAEDVKNCEGFDALIFENVRP
ncbi:MAG: glycerophosphodiester phosphodiesterase family protein [Eubacteriales bacterium]|nr:glycerophosphodiester phosphodiesterase family protein [Eubacteriales bacterium]